MLFTSYSKSVFNQNQILLKSIKKITNFFFNMSRVFTKKEKKQQTKTLRNLS
jgi:hypothetical protein